MTTIKAYAWQFVALALGALLLMQTLRLADAQTAEAQAIATLNTERATSERQARVLSENYRTLEGNHRDEIAKIGAAASAAIAAADSDAGRARTAAHGLQRDLATYITAHRVATQARAAAGNCTADTAPLDLLADLQRRVDERAGELAHIADTARARGLTCERAADSAHAVSERAQKQ
ncbi:MAG: DUF2514 family protein [Acidovorax sp.]|nr:DUF2514 family protein [Acidovorax sp.]